MVKLVITEEMLKDIAKYELSESEKMDESWFGGLFNGQPNKTRTILTPIMKKTPAKEISDRAIQRICFFETSKKFGYPMQRKDTEGYNNKDAKGKKTYGYGLLRHPLSGKYMQDVKQVWSQKELEDLFIQSVRKCADKVLSWAVQHNIVLGQNQLDAMTSAVYNFGQGFLNKNICGLISQNPDDKRIPELWRHLSDAQGRKYPGLLQRRNEEAGWYESDIFGGNSGIREERNND